MIPMSPTMIAAIAGVVISFAAGVKTASVYYTAEIEGMRKDKAQAALQAQVQNRKIEALGREVSDAAALANEIRNQEAEVVEKIVTKKVIEYVTQKEIVFVDRDLECNVPVEFVRVHDIAASGRVSEASEATPEPDYSPSDFGDTEVIGVVVNNYNSCNKIRNQLVSLQEWAVAVGNM